MIVEIEKPRNTVVTALDYNEEKVLRGVASLVGYANMDSVRREDIYALFSRYESGVCYPTRQKSFHASVNPSEKDDCTEEQVLSFIAGLMDHLGYGKQPYLVYRHFDIEREHYHVVSARINKDGHKINNHYEIKRASAYIRDNAQYFGFSTVKKGERVLRSDDLSLDPPMKKALRFDYSKEVTPQLRELFQKAVEYDFGTFQQLSFILEDLGVKAALCEPESKPNITLQGLNLKGAPVTEVFSEWSLGEPLYSKMAAALPVSRAAHKHRLREKERLRSLVGFAFDVSRSEGHFVNILKKKGIGVHFSRTKASGDIFGVTFVDHVTRMVFKSSEIRDVLSVGKMQAAVASGKWRPEERGRKQSSFITTRREVARQAAIDWRDNAADLFARVLRPVGQPKGASWGGKTAPSDEQRRAEWDAGRAGALHVDFKDRRFEEKLK